MLCYAVLCGYYSDYTYTYTYIYPLPLYQFDPYVMVSTMTKFVMSCLSVCPLGEIPSNLQVALFVQSYVYRVQVAIGTRYNYSTSTVYIII